MDRFKNKEKIDNGMTSTVYKVDGPRILKEIESLDSLKAIGILEQLKSYQNVSHKYLIKMHEIYTRWEPSCQTAYTCYLMDYYQNADLKTHLNKLRDNHEKVSFTAVKKWFGMIVEGMYYLYRYNLLHRNLKPSSLYITNSNLESNQNNFEIKIGDFGAISIIKDARTKTRIHPNGFDYVAPEIIDAQSYDEKSDIWSIGAILLDICTTSEFNLKEFHMKLLNVRHSDEVLEEFLSFIENAYQSNELIDLLKSLLNKNKTKRPNYKEIIVNPFTKECLSLIDSDLFRNNGSNNVDNSDIVLPDLPSFNAIVQYITENQNSEARVQSAIIRLADLVDLDNFDYSKESTQTLFRDLMEKYINNAKVQYSILKIIESSLRLIITEFLSKKIPNQQTSSNPYLDFNFLQKFFLVFVTHGNSRDVQFQSIKVLIQLANFENVSPYLCKHNVIKYILEGLSQHSDDALFCAYACKAIWALSIHENILKTYINMKCVDHMRRVLIRHSSDTYCVEMACNAVVALCMKEQIISSEEIDVDITSVIVSTLKRNLNSGNVVKSSCMSLTSLISLFEECAFRFICTPERTTQSEEEIDGISLLRQAYNIHKDNSEVVESICHVFKQLCNYDEMIIEMKSLQLDEKFLIHIKKRYRDNKSITKLCDYIVQKIQGENYQDNLENTL